MTRARGALRLLAVVLLAATFTGAALVILGASLGPESDLAQPPVTAVAERRTLRDVLVLRGAVEYAPQATVHLHRAGRVTALLVAPGEVLDDQTAVVEVDDRPVIAVRGEAPFWRDLARGDRGADVQRLQALLRRLGHEPGGVDGVFGAATAVAVRRWQEAHGLPADGRFRAGDVLVAPLPARIGNVTVAVGDTVTQGTEILVLTAAQPDAVVELTASSRLRVQTGNAATVEVVATGTVVSGTVDELSATPVAGAGDNTDAGQQHYLGRIMLQQSLLAVEGADVRVTVVLAERVDVLAVPVAAVVLDGEGREGVRVRTASGARFREVVVGMSEGAYVAVSGDLVEGDEVVLGESDDEA